MNSQVTIVSICKDPEIGAVMKRLLEQEANWHCISCTCVETVSQTLSENRRIDAVLLGSGLTADEETAIKMKLQELDASIPVIPHYGGGSGLIWAEVKAALNVH